MTDKDFIHKTMEFFHSDLDATDFASAMGDLCRDYKQDIPNNKNIRRLEVLKAG